MGHAVGGVFDTPKPGDQMDNTIMYENPVEVELDLPIRTSYQ
jgi:hypothetical protein